jgi:hypothetical protein
MYWLYMELYIVMFHNFNIFRHYVLIFILTNKNKDIDKAVKSLIEERHEVIG